VLLSFAVTTVLLITALRLLSSRMLLRSYADLEQQSVTRNLQRAGHAFEQLGSDLHLKTVNWSEWDDTYKFMADHNKAYLESNMAESGLATMQMDVVMLLDTRRRIFFARPVKREAGNKPPVPQRILSALNDDTSSEALFRRREGFFGVIRQPGGPLLISARPILTTTGKGPARGWLLFGRYFDAGEIKRLAERTRLNLQTHQVDSADIPGDCRQALRSLSDSRPLLVRPLDGDTVAGYTQVRDIFNRPLLLMKIQDRRSIYLQGVHSMNYLMRLIVTAALIFSIVTLAVLEFFVLSRISHLSMQVERIGDDSQSLSRVNIPGRDELSWLAGKINGMLDTLAENARRIRESEEKLRAYSENLEQIVEERTQQIEHQAFHDALTNLPNRDLFIDRLAHAQSRARRQKRGVGVIFMDMDNFKLINDSQGHEAGDILLIAIAERLKACVRPGDTIARLGGDEFTVLLEDLLCPEDAVGVAGRIMESLRGSIRLPQSEVFASGSIGIAYSVDSTESPEVLLRNADTAMYQAKANGKGGYVVFNQSMNDRVVERMEVEIGLRRALEQGEFRVYYQPLLNLETGRVSGIEALVRWEHPTRGLVSPGQFIPIAEETGLIVPLGYWVLEEACHRTKSWQEEYPDEPPLTVNVNLSGRQLQREDVVERVAAILEKTGLDPQYLKLEITESVLMADLDEAAARLHQLKGLGVKLAIDDFGTGYSSMSTLNAFPVDTVKIDRAFISRLADDEDAAAVVAAIVMLCKTMALDVTGEGIETPEQLAQLQGMGCDTGQGFYFSRPVPEDIFEEQLKAGRQTLAKTGDATQKEIIERLLDHFPSESERQAA
jgi:diguanylate cyclase (GGDEF)-like protein